MAGSIRTRTVLAMNLLVIGVGLAAGWVGISVAGREVERRLIAEPADNAASLVGRLNLPLSRRLMDQLAQLLGAEVAAGPADHAGGITASSLTDEATAELAAALANEAPPPQRVRLAGQPYRLAARPVAGADQPPSPHRLYLLVAESKVTAAKRQAGWTIALVTGAAVVLATLLGFWISTTISRPIRRLAQRMDHLASPSAGADSPQLDQPPLAPDTPGPTPAATAGETAAADQPAAETTAEPTELVRLERSFDQLLGRLDHARRQLAHSARLATLGQLAAAIAHELRNPLSGIKMNARVLADELAQAGIADRSIELIIREIERMDLYVGELLTLASPPAPTNANGPVAPGGPSAAPISASLPDRRELVSLESLVQSVVELLAGRCAHGRVEVETAVEPTASPMGDPSQLRQVILNLMLNALDAMPHGGRLTVRVGPAGNDRVRLSVSDTGEGVRVPTGADIFDPFVTTKPTGTGLGLAICRQIVSRHGGQIGYETANDGSTFWLELPAGASE